MAKSILSNEKRCIICGSTDVHKHHIFMGSANRTVSEREGCWVYLCPEHHNMSNDGVHFNICFNLTLKMFCQYAWEHEKGTRDEFRERFGKSYL